METGFLRSFDAWISRLVDFASADPLRRHGKVKIPPPPPPAEVRPAAPKKAERRPAATKPAKKPAAKKVTAKKPAAKKPAAKKPAAKKPAAKKPAAKKPKAPAPRETTGLEAVEREILDALASLGGTAAMQELVAETGEARSLLSGSLKKLAAAGRVRRVGAGLKTRYERVEE